MKTLKRILIYRLKRFISSFINSFTDSQDLPLATLLGDRQVALFVLIRKLVALFALYLLAVTIFFFIGNYQELTDQTLLIIVTSSSIATIILLIFCVINFVQSIICLILIIKVHSLSTTPIRAIIYYIVHALFMLFLVVVSLSFLLFYNGVTILSGGI